METNPILNLVNFSQQCHFSKLEKSYLGRHAYDDNADMQTCMIIIMLDFKMEKKRAMCNM